MQKKKKEKSRQYLTLPEIISSCFVKHHKRMAIHWGHCILSGLSLMICNNFSCFVLLKYGNGNMSFAPPLFQFFWWKIGFLIDGTILQATMDNLVLSGRFDESLFDILKWDVLCLLVWS